MFVGKEVLEGFPFVSVVVLTPQQLAAMVTSLRCPSFSLAMHGWNQSEQLRTSTKAKHVLMAIRLPYHLNVVFDVLGHALLVKTRTVADVVEVLEIL